MGMLVNVGSAVMGLLFGLWYMWSLRRSGKLILGCARSNRRRHGAVRCYIHDSLLRTFVIIPLFILLALLLGTSMLFLLLGVAVVLVCFAARRLYGN